MGWKYRKGKPYYYRSERVGGKVVSIYCGPAGSERARLWMSLDQMRKERRQQEAAERAIARAEWAELTSTPAPLVELLAEARRATAEALQAAGYHQYKRGEWRKQREHKDKDQDQSPSS